MRALLAPIANKSDPPFCLVFIQISIVSFFAVTRETLPWENPVVMETNSTSYDMGMTVRVVQVGLYASTALVGLGGNVLTLLALTMRKPVTNLSRYYLLNLCL